MSSCLPGKEQFVFLCCSCLPPVSCVFNEARDDVPRPRTTQQPAPGGLCPRELVLAPHTALGGNRNGCQLLKELLSAPCMSTATGRVKHISLLCSRWKYPLQKRLKRLMRSLARGYGRFPRSQKLPEMLL